LTDEKRTDENPTKRHILIVEDNPADLYLIQEALETAHIDANVHSVEDGEEALHFIDRTSADPNAPCPCLLIVDINLPKLSGIEILQQLRKSERCSNALVLVVSSTESTSDRAAMSTYGTNGFFQKPSRVEEFLKLGQVVREMLPV
jgi:chemotaxis family two-component system response regulator Rcp1